MAQKDFLGIFPAELTAQSIQLKVEEDFRAYTKVLYDTCLRKIRDELNYPLRVIIPDWAFIDTSGNPKGKSIDLVKSKLELEGKYIVHIILHELVNTTDMRDHEDVMYISLPK